MVVVRKSSMKMPGMSHARDHKLADVIGISIRARRSGIRPGLRRGRVGEVPAASYAPVQLSERWTAA
ncbi:MAG TPA: hypothetical protein VLH56_04850 [Dissulfurispiraceae bacterium]|nr:hypothetical protein [Dissulfurispiraceae bacterium]